MLNSNLIKENFILSSNSGLWFENIILTNEGINFLNKDSSSYKNIIMFVPNSKNSLSDMLVLDTPEIFQKQELEIPIKLNSKKKNDNNIPRQFNFEDDCGKKSFNQELLDDNLQEKYNLTNLPLFNQLIQYRCEESRIRKIAPYRVLTNQTLEEIVKLKPTTENELKCISGIGDAKIRDYGKDLIKLVKESV